MRDAFFRVVTLLIVAAAAAGAGYYWATSNHGSTPFPNPLVSEPPRPLLRYSIPNLQYWQFQTSALQLEDVLSDQETYTSYLFSYTTLGKRMTGQINIPKPLPAQAPAIIMVRGFVPLDTYTTGVGTRNAARVYAENGFITVAPDFFGYGDSAPEPEDGWQARFEKPIVVIELLKSLQAQPVTIPAAISDTETNQDVTIGNIGFWGHSNGGQIVLTSLEVLGESYPTTLWAPVTVPFPYSVLFFTDEAEDEGKGMRAWLSILERDYDVFDFSLTQHLDRLAGPFQLHHGEADEAALKTWSDEFVAKVNQENSRRETELESLATISATTITDPLLLPIEYQYFIYPGADHNLMPGWDVVTQRDVDFFQSHLLN